MTRAVRQPAAHAVAVLRSAPERAARGPRSACAATIAGDFGQTPGRLTRSCSRSRRRPSSATPHGTFAYLIEPDQLRRDERRGQASRAPSIKVCTNADHDGLCIDGANFVDVSRERGARRTISSSGSTPAQLVSRGRVRPERARADAAAAADDTDLARPARPGLERRDVVSRTSSYVIDIDGDGTNELVAGLRAARGPNDVTLGDGDRVPPEQRRHDRVQRTRSSTAGAAARWRRRTSCGTSGSTRCSRARRRTSSRCA